jgi:hypothetical protein
MYDSVLYDLPKTTKYKNAVRLGKELGLTDSNDSTEYVDYVEAIELIEYVAFHFEEIKTKIKMPDISIDLDNASNVNLNDYLLEINKIPDGLIREFNKDGWKVVIDLDYINSLSNLYKVNCNGATKIKEKTIYIATPNAILHEFGHYVDNKFNSAKKHSELYLVEYQKAPIKNYYKSNANEYFAECFAMYIKGEVKLLKQLCPETYNYIKRLSADW